MDGTGGVVMAMQNPYHPAFQLGQVVERQLPNGQMLRVVIGDINGDGHIDQDDLEILQMITSEGYLGEFLLDRLSMEELAACDVNGDGTINHADLVLLCNAILAQMEMISMTDELTGLLNRRGLKEKAYLKLRSAKKFDTPLSCLAIDIDYFKKINDTYGHDTGDKVLCHMAQVLKDCTRNYDLVSRYGGEEFVVLLDQTDLDGAVIVAEKIQDRLDQSVFRVLQNGLQADIKLTISVGISLFNDSHNLHSLINKADEALYAAKEDGRNRVRLAPL